MLTNKEIAAKTQYPSGYSLPQTFLLITLTGNNTWLNEVNGILNTHTGCIAVVANNETKLFLDIFIPACINKLCNGVRSLSIESFVMSLDEKRNNLCFVLNLCEFHKLTQSRGQSFLLCLVPILILNLLRIAASCHSQKGAQTFASLALIELLLFNLHCGIAFLDCGFLRFGRCLSGCGHLSIL